MGLVTALATDRRTALVAVGFAVLATGFGADLSAGLGMVHS